MFWPRSLPVGRPSQPAGTRERVCLPIRSDLDPSASARIRQMENTVGTPLLNRDRRVGRSPLLVCCCCNTPHRAAPPGLRSTASVSIVGAARHHGLAQSRGLRTQNSLPSGSASTTHDTSL